MKTIRYFLLALLVLAPGLVSAQTLYADSLDIVIGGVAYPALAPSWTLLLEEDEIYGPFDMSVAEPAVACVTDPDIPAGIPTITNPEEVAGTVVIVARGQCNFTTKVTAAFNAGAVGIILWAVVQGGIDPFPAFGGSPSETTQLQSAFVSYNTGIAALDGEAIGEQVTFVQTYTTPPPVNPPNVTLDNGTIRTSLYASGFIGADPAFNFGEGFVFDGAHKDCT